MTYDARGHGLSGKPTSGYGFDHLVADAVAVIRAARLGKPVVVGHSWGAMVALELAVARPRSVSGITLIDGGVAPPGDRGPWKEFKARLAPPMLDGLPLEEFRAGMRRFSAVPVTPEIEELFLSLMRVDADDRIHPRLSRANHFRSTSTRSGSRIRPRCTAGCEPRRSRSLRAATMRHGTRRSAEASGRCEAAASRSR